MSSMTATAQDRQEKEQSASSDYSGSYRWDAFQLFDVRDTSSPVEIYIFDRENSDTFLGRARFFPSADSQIRKPVWIYLEGRGNLEEVSGRLEVGACFLENGPKLCKEDFVLSNLSATPSVYVKLDTGLTFVLTSIGYYDNVDLTLRKNIRSDGFVCPLKAIIPQPGSIDLYVDESRGGKFPWSYAGRMPGGGSKVTTARFYLAEIVLALEDLQGCNPRPFYFTIFDIHLDSLGHIAFRDFNLCVVETSKDFKTLEYLEYMAPEIVRAEYCHPHTIFWSLAVVVFEICCSRTPFTALAKDTREVVENICRMQVHFPPNLLGNVGKDLVESLLIKDPKKRLGATHGIEDVKSHPFFAEIDWVKLRRRDIIPPFKPRPPIKFANREFCSRLELKTSARREDEDIHISHSFELPNGSLSSYKSAESSFRPSSVYGTPASYPDIWSRGSAPSVGSFLKQMFATKEEKERRLKPEFLDLVRERGLQLPLSEEINWSGRGQHVEFNIAQEIPLRELNAIGHGGSAIVDSVLCRRVKLARKTMMCTRRQKLETMIIEVVHLQSLRHPHIIQLVGSYLQGRKFAILLYPVAQWNLSTFLELCHAYDTETGQETVGEQAISSKLRALPGFFQCITHAMAYIHANTIKHMDMKPQNILVRANVKSESLFAVYIADFGISKKFAADELSRTDSLIALTRKYCAPEVYDGEPRGRAADIFSLGCVFLEIATIIQSCSVDEFAEFRSHRTNPRDFNDDESYHANPDNVSRWIDKLRAIPQLGLTRREGIVEKLDLMQQMVKWNPDERPTASQVLDRLGGPRDCCEKERETYVIEEPSQNEQVY